MHSLAEHQAMSSPGKGGIVIDRTRVEAIRHLPIDPDEKGFGGPSRRCTVTAAQLVAARTSGSGGWLGISSPGTTFDKWRWIPVVDEDETIADVVRTFF